MSEPKLEHCQMGKGYVTVAYVRDPDTDCIDYAVALCSPLDRFSRRKGRMVAEGRLTAYRLGRDSLTDRGLAGTIFTTNPQPRKDEVIDTVIKLILAEADETPTRWLAEEKWARHR